MRITSRNPLRFLAGVSVLLLSLAMAQTSGLEVTSSNGFSNQLVTAEGMSIYVLAQDTDGVSTCVDACTNNWTPLTADAELALDEDVASDLLGTHERADGTVQLTYAGQPLYTYVRDNFPGDANGQMLGNIFFVLSAAGEAISGYAQPVVAEVSDEVFAELMTVGEQVYAQQCLACHGAEGQGAVGPRLAGNSNLARTSFLASRILNGYPEHGMPAYRDILDDEQVAALSTFVRNSWGNEAGPVVAEEVAEAR